MRMSGKCPRCPYRWTLRKDGTMGSHLLYTGSCNERKPCDGTGQKAVQGTEKLTR